jgi:heme-degrading monooxygenase HmoA
MIAVLFEFKPHLDQKDAFLAAKTRLGPLEESFEGVIGFESVANPEKVMAILYWRDAQTTGRWRNLDIHRKTTQQDRVQASADSNAAHVVSARILS